jgi:predicted dinucleotide-binding enzyme
MSSRPVDQDRDTRRSGARQHRIRCDQLVQALGGAGRPSRWSGRIVIDANNPIEAPLFKPVDLEGRVSSEVFAEVVSGARVVKAFNHLRAEILAGDPCAEGGRRILFYSGNDSGAKGGLPAW